MLDYKDICILLEQGKTQKEIAEIIARDTNEAFEKYNKQKQAEQEMKNKAAAATQTRNKLVQAMKNYLSVIGYELKGNVDSMISDMLIKIFEKEEFEFWDILKLF